MQQVIKQLQPLLKQGANQAIKLKNQVITPSFIRFESCHANPQNPLPMHKKCLIPHTKAPKLALWGPGAALFAGWMVWPAASK